MLFLQSAGIKKEPPRRTALNNIYKDVIALYDELQSLLNETSANQMKYINKKDQEESELKERKLKAKERIPDEIFKLNGEIKALRSELNAERARNKKAAASGKVFSLLSSVLVVLVAYLIEHHKEIISFFL